MAATQTIGTAPSQIPEPGLTRLLFADTRLALLWSILRLYVGYQWLEAGWSKLTNPAGVWVGAKSGSALAGFVNGALKKTTGEHPDVTGWYAGFLRELVLPHTTFFATLVTFGEILVGLGLIVGLFTGVAAFYGGLMNANFLLAGAVSLNPILFIPATWLVLAWRVAGYYGLDRWALPLVGVPGAPGALFRRREPAGTVAPVETHA